MLRDLPGAEAGPKDSPNSLALGVLDHGGGFGRPKASAPPGTLGQALNARDSLLNRTVQLGSARLLSVLAHALPQLLQELG
ncbi:hypothetical protein [Microvirga massiliensis]|uniref:hypothetical protein n=1 Tax=Microvirga massiliensis TaxID=1033741 RepID=UPI00062B3A7A|nr:hypothetical protein [Microvirga massiliensis]